MVVPIRDGTRVFKGTWQNALMLCHQARKSAPPVLKKVAQRGGWIPTHFPPTWKKSCCKIYITGAELTCKKKKNVMGGWAITPCSPLSCCRAWSPITNWKVGNMISNILSRAEQLFQAWHGGGKIFMQESPTTLWAKMFRVGTPIWEPLSTTGYIIQSWLGKLTIFCSEDCEINSLSC